MARPKQKESILTSMRLDKELYVKLSSYAEEKGQTKTMALERILKAFFIAQEERKTDGNS